MNYFDNRKWNLNFFSLIPNCISLSMCPLGKLCPQMNNFQITNFCAVSIQLNNNSGSLTCHFMFLLLQQ